MTRWISSWFASTRTPAAPRTRLGVEALDRRDLPSIMLLGTQVCITGNSSNDIVNVTRDIKGTFSPYDDTITVSRYYGSSGNPADNLFWWINSESTTYDLYDATRGGSEANLTSVKASLGNGWNEFMNSTSLPCKVTGGADPDELTGGSGPDRLWGQGGNDVLSGKGGDDELFAGAGWDDLYGGSGVDTLVSTDSGYDDLWGGDAGSGYGVYDSYWKDPLDTIKSPSLVSSRRIHTVSSFEPLKQGYTTQYPGLTPAGEDLMEPAARDGHVVTKQDFSGNPLFPSAGPAYNDVDQGSVGDCYFVSRLSALAHKQPDYLQDLVVDLGDGTYAVQFKNEDGYRKFYRVDGEMWVSSPNVPKYADLAADGAVWVAVIEKAYAFARNNEGTYESLNGGNSAHVIDHIQGLGLAYTKYIPTVGEGMAYAVWLKNELAAGKAVTMGTPAGFNNSTPMIEENKGRGAHIPMVHSVETLWGVPVKVNLYNLYGGGLTEITDFDRLAYCSGGATSHTTPSL